MDICEFLDIKWIGGQIGEKAIKKLFECPAWPS
jgi:hypothetical protein